MADIEALYESGLSLPDIERHTGIPRSTVRRHLIAGGVVLRERVAAAIMSGKLGKHAIGKRRSFTDAHRAAMSVARRAWADRNAVGVSLKPSGYLEYTRGEHKGRGVHRVLMEKKLGRRLPFSEVVHHRDENKTNNDDLNLELMTRPAHTSHHRRSA